MQSFIIDSYKLLLVVVWFVLYFFRILFWSNNNEHDNASTSSTNESSAATTITTRTIVIPINTGTRTFGYVNQTTSETSKEPLVVHEDEKFPPVEQVEQLEQQQPEQQQQSVSVTIRQGALTKDHKQLFMTRKWKRILSWAAFHPDQVESYVDPQCHSSLHLACLFNAPEPVIATLLFASGGKLAFVANCDGELPLHWAVMLSMDRSVLRLLLQANPTSAFVRDKHGNFPLSFLWDRHKNSILQTWCQAGTTTPARGVEALMSHGGWKQIMDVFRVFYNHQSSLNNRILGGHDRDQLQSLLLAENHDSILQKKYASPPTASQQPSSSSFLPLHVMASGPCPSALFPLLMRVFQDEIQVKDEEGCYPLHRACENPISNRSFDDATKLELLVNEYPKAAAESSSGGKQLPLHLAAESGIFWTEGIEPLFEAYPEALSTRDPVTGLYPFMLAGVGSRNRSKMMDANGSGSSVDVEMDKEIPSAESLSTIYSLLRNQPELLCN